MPEFLSCVRSQLHFYFSEENKRFFNLQWLQTFWFFIHSVDLDYNFTISCQQVFTPAYVSNTPTPFRPSVIGAMCLHPAIGCSIICALDLCYSIITSCISMRLKHVWVLALKKSLKQIPSSSYCYVFHKLLIMRVMYTSCFYVFTRHSFYTPTPSGLGSHNSTKRLLAIVRIAPLMANAKLLPSVLFLLDQSLLVDYTFFGFLITYFFSFPSTPNLAIFLYSSIVQQILQNIRVCQALYVEHVNSGQNNKILAPKYFTF